MSERKDNNGTGDQNDPTVQNGLGGTKPPDKNKQGNSFPGLPTIEEHAANMNIDAPVFTAVMQNKQWASGKRVPETEFEKAVKDFLNAPMGGK
jgi:hypothetical protein